MRARFALSVAVILLLLASITPSYASTETVTWYFRSDTHTVNGVMGYVLNETLTDTSKNVTLSDSGDLTVYWGWQVWRVRSDGSQVQLTGIQDYTSRSTDGEGLQTLNWAVPSRSLQIGFDALKVVLYMKVGSGDWTSKAIFVTARLLQKGLVGTTWTIKAYTKRLYSGGVTTGTFFWGSETYQSRIEGVTFDNPDVYENMNYKLQTGDFIGFILYPYVNLIGNLFYGLVMLMICVPLYNRYRSLTPILVLFIIFGGATGVFTMLVPVAGLNIAWIFLLLGLAGLLYKVFR